MSHPQVLLDLSHLSGVYNWISRGRSSTHDSLRARFKPVLVPLGTAAGFPSLTANVAELGPADASTGSSNRRD